MNKSDFKSVLKDKIEHTKSHNHTLIDMFNDNGEEFETELWGEIVNTAPK